VRWRYPIARHKSRSTPILRGEFDGAFVTARFSRGPVCLHNWRFAGDSVPRAVIDTMPAISAPAPGYWDPRPASLWSFPRTRRSRFHSNPGVAHFAGVRYYGWQQHGLVLDQPSQRYSCGATVETVAMAWFAFDAMDCGCRRGKGGKECDQTAGIWRGGQRCDHVEDFRRNALQNGNRFDNSRLVRPIAGDEFFISRKSLTRLVSMTFEATVDFWLQGNPDVDGHRFLAHLPQLQTATPSATSASTI